ncbi:MAG: MATE family efflux transporter [Candidatus Thermoplasmatota archaeon]|nr:MATE family efflux transporter [Euryarchaeota archaeon]MBU4031893.1 MATE family efflux transporter [Candidatus Thermoplasmatota archaeon]MBU4070592.1 MATE family efflux transporter [Candidatus Thermoplasmatota archaeon]MBU4143764.1 MATE family efflux transporter [Candidatus Thermoplasmatota archaeon]MBU4591402.1 MATE family efflux transporter [Candidatus Thermoplasmatota archaeon]
MQKDILHGPIARTLFMLGWPLMLTNAFQMAYSVADMYWLGKFIGTEGIAATSLSWPLVFFLISFAGGMSVAGTTLVSQYTGVKDTEEVKKSAGQVFTLLLLVSIITSIVGILVTDTLLNFMGAPDEVIVRSSPYVKIIFSSIPFMFIIMTYSSILRGWGDTRTPMLIAGVSVVINLVLDPFLIAGIGPFPALGVAGAAVATLFARGVAAAACIYLLFRGKNTLTIGLEHMKMEAQKIKQIFKIGLPASLGQSMVAIGFVIMMGLVAGFGTVSLATYGIGTRIVNLLFIVTGGITGAAVTMMGQSLGAENLDRAGKVLRTSILITTGFLLVCSTVLFAFSEQAFGIFSDDPNVISASSKFVLAFGFSIMGFGIFSSVQSAYQASGHTVPTLLMGLVRLWGMRVPFSFILAILLGWGVSGIWVGMGLSNYLSAALALAWAATGTWKVNMINEKKTVLLEDGRA